MAFYFSDHIILFIYTQNRKMLLEIKYTSTLIPKLSFNCGHTEEFQKYISFSNVGYSNKFIKTLWLICSAKTMYHLLNVLKQVKSNV